MITLIFFANFFIMVILFFIWSTSNLLNILVKVLLFILSVLNFLLWINSFDIPQTIGTIRLY